MTGLVRLGNSAAAIEAFLGAIRLETGTPSADRRAGHVVAHVRRPHDGDRYAEAGLKDLIALAERRREKPPLFVSYFTADTPYEALAERLRLSLDRFGLPHRIEAIPSRGSWVANTGLKAAFIERVWQESDGPICWVDADAEILRTPYFVFDNPFDFSAVQRHGWYVMSGLIYLNKTEGAGAIVHRWNELCRANPHVWDQVLLTLAWFQTARERDLSTLWMNDGIFRFPRPWLRDLRDRVLYYPRQKKMRPFIDQKQASRSLKAFVDGSKKRENERGSDDLSEGFMTALKVYDFSFDARIETIFRA
ncbi:hypothetical protein [Ciceribacter sp. RN22]|uniref:hypothetical protein n=1 Tax=Ciceribacter sp. RN22 TaxID=2954932 RepID=UPI0020925402|nr:hypothetical protein [Ciceribacter sp. RN22]MCO6178866.1 hypothetical protein [Ciceribacter sp. RN22]